jgi:hypothetical protein
VTVIPQTDGVPDHAAPEPLTAAQFDAVTADVVEPKVRAATAAGASSAATLLPFVLWLLATYVFPDGVPLPVQGVVGLLVTGACTFAAGYYARHVDRAPVLS